MSVRDRDGSLLGRMLGRWERPLAVGLIALALTAAAFMTASGLSDLLSRGLVAIDYHTHRAFALRFLDTGSMYLPYQLTGPFNPIPEPHIPGIMPSMYPPIAIYLFAPFLVLPWILWWAIPLGVLLYALWRWRPSLWVWPVLILLAAHGTTTAAIASGNTNMWISAFNAAGLIWAWPAVLVLIKPSLLVFAFIGIRRRSWWIGAAVLVALSLPLLGQWLDYVSVVSNAETSLGYSVRQWPILVLPLAAWLARTRQRSPMFSWPRSVSQPEVRVGAEG